jgi:hypothetical protein
MQLHRQLRSLIDAHNSTGKRISTGKGIELRLHYLISTGKGKPTYGETNYRFENTDEHWPGKSGI